MKSKDFLISKIKWLNNCFPQLSIKYQFDESDNTHLIEVMPLLDFENNSEYQNAEAELTFEFEQLFFPETVLFISKNSLTKITASEFEIGPSFTYEYSFDQKVFITEETNQNFIYGGKQKKKFAGNDYDYALAA